jgi:hypothetical protein
MAAGQILRQRILLGLGALSKPLADDFEQADPGGNRNIEATDRSGHG